MPLYIDYHQFEHITVEEVKEAHMADQKIQDLYGVKYHQFWVNEEAASVFCLIEGPDMDTCELVHKLAHGSLACALTEVKEGLFKLTLGQNKKAEGGIVRNESGSIDPGYRYMLVASLRGITTARDLTQIDQLLIPQWAREIVLDTSNANGGNQFPWEIDDSLITVFDTAECALKTATGIAEKINKNKNQTPPVIFKIGVAAGQPLTRNGGLFDQTLLQAHHLSNAAADNQILVSTLTIKLATSSPISVNSNLKIISPKEEQLLDNLFKIVEQKGFDGSLQIESLSKSIGISRPQLYRKIKSLTGKSPSNFIRDLRLIKAKNLLQQKSLNVSEVAYEVGYNNLSYFSKCFSEKYGFKPSSL